MTIVSASQDINSITGQKVVSFYDEYGNLVQQNIGGTRPARNNNPGSVSYSPSEIGADHIVVNGVSTSLAIFASYSDGISAQISLLNSGIRGNPLYYTGDSATYSASDTKFVSINTAIERYTQPNNPDPNYPTELANYQAAVIKAANAADPSNAINGDTSSLLSLTPAQFTAAVQAFDTSEGYYNGAPQTINYTTDANGNLHVVAPLTLGQRYQIINGPFYYKNPLNKGIVEVTALDDNNNAVVDQHYSTPVSIEGATSATLDNGVITESFGGSSSGASPVTETINPDGSAQLSFLNNGVTSTVSVANSADALTEIAGVFGASLGQTLAGSNPLAAIALSSVTGPIVSDIISFAASSGDLSRSFDTLVNDFPQSVKEAGAGAAASYLFANLVNALGVNGFPASVLDTFGGHAVATLATNLVTPGADAITGTGSATSDLSNVGNWELVGAEFIGSELGGAIYQPSTQAGDIGAGVLTTLNGAYDAYLAFENPAILSNPFFFEAVAVFAVLDQVFGGLIGDLFGQQFTSHIAGASFSITSSTASNSIYNYQDGPTSDAEAIGGSVSSALTDALSAVNGTVTNLGSLTQFGIGFNTDASPSTDANGYYNANGGLCYYYDANGVREQYWANNTTLQTITDYAIMRELSEMIFSGGDPYAERAIDATLRSAIAPTASTLAGYLKIAQDYEIYEANQVTVNELVASNPNSSFAQTWTAEMLIAGSMGLGTSVQGSTGNDVLAIENTVDASGNSISDKILIGGGGSDTYTYSAGDGAVTVVNGVAPYNVMEGAVNFTNVNYGTAQTITVSGDTEYGSYSFTIPSIDSNNITFSQNGADLVISIAGDSADTVTIEGWFADSFAQTQSINFADGGEVSGSAIDAQFNIASSNYGIAGTNAFTDNDPTVTGGGGQDVLVGSSVNNTFIAGGGADVVYGGGGTDTYDLNYAGQLTIYNNVTMDGTAEGSGASGTLNIGRGALYSNLVFTKAGNDLEINILGGSSSVTIKNWNAATYARLQTITSADGVTYNYAATGGGGFSLTATDSRNWYSWSTETMLFDATGAEYQLNLVTDGGVSESFAAVAMSDGEILTASATSFTLVGTGTDTVTGNGNLFALDSGDTLTANGNGNAVTSNGSGDNIALTGTGNTVAVNGSDATITASSGTQVTLGNSVNAAIDGSGIAIAASTGDTITISGTGDAISTVGATTITLEGNSGATITGSGDTITLNGAGDTLTVNGSSNVINVAGTGVTIGGSGVNTINFNANTTGTITSGGQTINVNGTGVGITSAYNYVNLAGGAAVTLTGGGNAVTMAMNSSIYATGTNGVADSISATIGIVSLDPNVQANISSTGGITINAASGDTIGIGGNGMYGSNNQINLSSGTVNVGANSLTNVAGSNDQLNVGANDEFGITGNNDTVTVSAAGSVIWVNGSANTVNGSGDTLVVLPGAQITVNGGGDTLQTIGSDAYTATLENTDGDADSITTTTGTISLNANVQANISSTGGVTVNGASGDTIGIGGNGMYGSNNQVNLSNGTVNVAANSLTNVAGTNDQINVGANDEFGITGNNDTVTVSAAGSVIWVNDSANDTVNGSGDTLVVWAGAQVTVNGGGDTLQTVGSGGFTATLENTNGNFDSITGTSDTINFNAGAQSTLTGSNFTANLVSNSGSTVNFGANSSGSVTGTGIQINIDGVDVVTTSYNYVHVASGDAVTLLGGGNAVTMDPNSSVQVQATNGVADSITATTGSVTLIANIQANITSTGGLTINGASGDTIGIGGNGSWGTSDSVNVSSSTINLQAYSRADISGSSDTVSLGYADGMAISGNYNIVNAANGADTIWVGGTGDNFNATGDNLNLGAGSNATVSGGGNSIATNGSGAFTVTIANTNGSFDSINGTSDTINFNAGAQANLSGTNFGANLTSNSGSTVNFGANSSGSVSGTGNTIGITGTSVAVNSSYNYVNMVGGSALAITGAGNAITMAANASVNIDGTNGTADSVSATSDVVSLNANDQANINSTGGTTVYGSGGDTIGLGGNGMYGANNQVDMSGGTVNLATNSLANLSGSYNTINLGSSDEFGFGGEYNTVTSNNSGNGIWVNGGTTNTVNATGDSIFIYTNVHATINGNNNNIVPNSGDSDLITANGNGDAISISGSNNTILLNGTNAQINTTSQTSDTGVSIGDNSSFTLTGSNTAAFGGNGTTISINSGASGDLVVFGGNSNTLNASNTTLWMTGSNDFSVVNGTGDTISVQGSNDWVLLNGTWQYFSSPSTIYDPLVLNLAGGSVSTTSEQDSGVTFDMRGDGGHEATGWVTSGEGFLVVDPDDAPITSRDQMFSNALVPGVNSGLGALATYDSNGDGKIDASDPNFSDIKVWVPGDGQSAGTIYTLAQLGISEIDLQGTVIDSLDSGNQILNSFGFKYADGTTGQGAEVGFDTAPDTTSIGNQLAALIQAMAASPTSSAMLDTPAFSAIASTPVVQTALAVHH